MLQSMQRVAPNVPSELIGDTTRCSDLQHNLRTSRQIDRASIAINREPIRHQMHARALPFSSRGGWCKNPACTNFLRAERARAARVLQTSESKDG
jgi:hypothetical protein